MLKSMTYRLTVLLLPDGFRVASQHAASMYWDLLHLDLKTAFLQGETYDLDRRVIHVQLPTDIGLPPYVVGLCTRSVYGLADAPRRWWNRLDKFLISLGIQPTRADRCTYVCHDGAFKEPKQVGFADSEATEPAPVTYYVSSQESEETRDESSDIAEEVHKSLLVEERLFSACYQQTQTWKQRKDFKEKKVEDCAWTPVVDETLLKFLESVEHKSGWYPFANGHAQVAYRAKALRTPDSHYDRKKFHLRTSIVKRKGVWWLLEMNHDLNKENVSTSLEEEAEVLVSVFLPSERTYLVTTPQLTPKIVEELLEHFMDPVNGSNAKGRKPIGMCCLHVDDLFIPHIYVWGFCSPRVGFLFPTCGVFVFSSVSAPLPPPPSRPPPRPPPSQSLTHSLIDTHSLTHSFTHSLTPWRSLVSAALPVAFAWQARHLVLCKGSDVRPGVPWSPLLFAWQAQHLLLCKGSDVRSGVPWSPLLCRWLLRGRRGTWCSARGRMYTLASLGLRCFLRAGAALAALQRPWSPLLCRWLLRGRRGTWCSARGRMYAVPWSPVAFAWQARHLMLCKGSDVRPGVPWSPPLCRWLLRGRRSTWCSARRRMYALAFLGLRRSAGGFYWQARHLVLCQGSDVRPGVPWSPLLFAWQAQHLVSPRPGVPWSPPLCRWLLRGRCGTWCSARDRMYALWRPFVSAALPMAFRGSGSSWCCARGRMFALVSLGLCYFLRGMRGTWCSAKGQMYALASLGLHCCLRVRRGTWCSARGRMTPWRPLVSAALPLAFAWQAQHLLLCKGSDVRPGVPWSPLLCR